MKLDVHNESGKVVGKVSLDEAMLGERIRKRLMRDAVLMYEARSRLGTAKVKSKAERSGSGAKPWAQKGTGYARTGDNRSPIWRKGGRVHGPVNRDYNYSMPKRALREAVKSALLAKLKDSEVVVIDSLSYDEPKTRRMTATLKALGIDGSCLVSILSPATDEARLGQVNLLKSLRNIPRIHLTTTKDWNAYELLRHRRILLTRDALENLSEVMP